MDKNIRYDGNNKTFSLPKKKSKLKREVKIVIFAFLSLILLSLCGYFISLSVSFGSSLHVIHYNESGTNDYRVMLKENDHYEDSTLGPGLSYITSIIDTINIDFFYELSSNEIMDLNYEYEVYADLIINNRNEPDLVVHQKTYEILSEAIVLNGSTFIIDEEVLIDYDTYEDYVLSFKDDYSLSIDSNLVVTFKVKATGVSDSIDNKLDSSKTMSVTIPIGEQTIEIDQSKKVYGSSYITDINDAKIENMPLFIFSILLGVFGISAILSAFIGITKLSKKDIYQSTIKKYLREFDRMIITSKQPSINESSFENKIRVMSIEELVDAHDTTGSPIIYYEVVPDEKSYFIIAAGNTLYKLTISRAYLEENGK